MNKKTLATLSLLATLGLTATAALPAQASNPTLHFSSAIPNSPGPDTGTNYSLNQEGVRLTNSSSSSSYNLKGWTIRDRANHVYAFGAFTLKPGATVTLHTGTGTNTSGNVYWDRKWYVWNNNGDTAYLKNTSGTQKDSCSWGSVSNGYKVVC